MPFCPAVLFQGRCMESCPTGLYQLQTTCVDACPPGTVVLRMNETLACVPQFDGPTSCEEAVPGSHMDFASHDCVCNKTDWMVRNRTVADRVATFCAPASTADAPPMACASFISGAWFDPAVQMCQCRRDVPLIVANPADRALPYACVAALADPTVAVYRCNETSFFDFRIDSCAPRPPAPSVLPPPPPAPSVLPPPSQNPIRIPSAEPPVPLPSQLAPSPIVVAPSRSALPSYAKTPMPSVAPARRSAAPSRRPARSIAPTQRPATVQSTLNLPGARIAENTTATTATQTVQNIQAAIACSLRLPPEKVVIRNITVMRPDGTAWNLPITTLLSGNGTVLCYSLGVATPARLLQGTATGDSSIAVDYTVVEPPDEVLSLSATELTTTLAASAMMQEVVAATGATTLTATTDSSLASAPAPSSGPGSTDESNKGLIMVAGGVGAGAAVLVIALAAIAAVIVLRSQRRPVQGAKSAAPLPEKPQPTVFVVMNPTEAAQANPMLTPTTQRMGFEPTLLNRGARV